MRGLNAAAPLALAAAIALAGCGSVPATVLSSAAAPASSGTGGAPAVAGPPTVRVAQSRTLGAILVDGQGRTLYTYAKDGAGKSNCTGSCAVTWPPLTAPGTPVPGSNVSGSLSLISRTNGQQQVAINGHPLYRYSGDTIPGSTSGQAFGGLWYAVTPSGGRAGGAATATVGQATVEVAGNATLGRILVDDKGMTLYLHTSDRGGISTCAGGCASVWKLVLWTGSGKPTAGPGVTGKVGLAAQPDGQQAVAVNGQPLYLYTGDKQPGQATGEGVSQLWYAVQPSGAQAFPPSG